MAKAKLTEKQEETTSNDTLASLLNQHKQDHYNEVEPLHTFISTGSLLLDQYIKIRSGSVCRLVARLPESGKTRQSFVLATNYMQKMPKSKTLYVKAEGRLSPELQKAVGLTFVTNPNDWKYGSVFVLCSNVFETVANICSTLIKEMHDKGEHLCIILDSLDGLILRADLETKGIQDGKIAGVPKLTKLLFRHLALPITHYDALLIITGQYSADISIDPYAPKAPRLGDASGGSAIPHQCDYILSYQPRWNGDIILEDPDAKPGSPSYKQIGQNVRVDIKKSTTDTSGNRIEIPIRKNKIGCAIWAEREVVDILRSYDQIRRESAQGSFIFDLKLIEEAKSDGVILKEKIRSEKALYDYVENDKVAFEWLYKRVKNLIITE